MASAKKKASAKSKENEKKIYCTCCGKEKKSSSFYESQSRLYKTLGYLPVCKTCINNIYNEYEKKYKNNKEVIYNLCRLFDMPFLNAAFEGAVQHSEKTGWKLYQSYFKQINSFGKINNTGNCFEDGEILYPKDGNDYDDKHIPEEVKLFWGYGFSERDYIFLENELSEWKKTHKCDNQAELTLLKEICIKILEIRRKREKKENVGKNQKELQELMKTASVDPAKANAISSGQAVDRFGVWIKDIERYKPAEWWENQEKYVDMDGFKPYLKDYIVRPIKNFFTGAKDFFVENKDMSLKG